jgi:hypothetical protein
MADSLNVPLRVKTDRNGDEFLVGSFDFPAMVDLSKVSFFVFYPEEGGDKASLMIRPKDFKPRHRNPSDSPPEQE